MVAFFRFSFFCLFVCLFVCLSVLLLLCSFKIYFNFLVFSINAIS